MDAPVFLGESLAGWLWRSSWQAAVLALLVLAIQGIAGRRLSAAWRYRLWILVLARLMLPVSVPSGWSVFNVAWLQPWPRVTATLAGSPASAIPASTSPEAAPGPNLGPRREAGRLPLPAEGQVLPAPTPELADPAAPEPVAQTLGPSAGREAWKDAGAQSAGVSTPTTGPSTRAFGWMVLWAAGVLILGGRGWAQMWHFSRRLRREAAPAGEREVRLFEGCRRQLGIRGAVLLRETSLVSSPALFGLWQPTVLLPRTLAGAFSDDELRHVLLHELAHVRRRDLWVHALGSVMRILHWFNPVLWLAFRRMQADRELATDALALSVAGEQEARSYGSTILKVLEGWSPAVRTVPGVGILEDRHWMRDRIRRIAAFRRPSRTSAWAAVPVVALAAATLTDAQSSRVKEASPAAQAEAFTPVDLRPHLVTRWSAIKPGSPWEAGPKGEQWFGGVPFELTGLVEVAGIENLESGRESPTRASGIRVGRRVAALHLLHGAGFRVPDGTVIARLILHYANGQSRELPIRYGEHVRHWWREPDEASESLADAQSRVAWTGTGSETDPLRSTLHLFHTRLSNPLPDQVLESIDLVSTLTRCSEVLLGLTTEAVGAAVPDVFVAAAGAVPVPGGGKFHPVPLERFCTRTYEVIDQDPDSSWAYAPHGRHVFNGVLFDLPGVMEVSGLGAARDDNPLPTSIRDIPLGKAARRLHVLHGGAADLADGTPLAKLVLHYADGRQHELRLVYGVNVRNWYKGGDKRDDVSDPNTRLGWTGDSPRSRRFGSTLRIYHTTFDLPWPEIELRSLDFVSLLSESVSVIPAITLETGMITGAVAGVASAPTSTAAAPAPAPPSSEVKVRVLDDATGQPIPGASVRLRLADGRRNFRFGEQKANARGDLILDVLRDGPTNRTVEARAPGYLPADAVLNPGPLPEEVSIRLKAGTRVGGTVLDSRDRPVSGAEVRIRGVTRDDAGQFVETLLDAVATDEAGRWTTGSIQGTPEGLTFLVTHVDHLPLEVEQASPAGSPGSAAPTATQLLEGQARFVLEDPPEISGRVFGGRGNQPVAAAEVVVATGPNFVNRRFTRTGADGRFRLAVPEPGFARLVVQAPGFAPNLTSFEVERRTRAQEVRLAPARRLQGRVVDAAGQPVAKAWLYVGNWQGVNVLTWRTETDAEGRFAWEAAPRESFLLVADQAGHQQAHQTVLPAAPNEAVTEVTVTLTAGFAFEGAVFDAETRRPIEGFHVLMALDTALDESASSTLEWQRPESMDQSPGAFRFASDFRHRSYLGNQVKVLVTAPGYQPRMSPNLPNSGAHRMTFELTRGADLRGVVESADGRPVAGAQVATLGMLRLRLGKAGLEGAPGDSGILTVTDPDGRFTLPVWQSAARWVACHPKEGFAEITITNPTPGGKIVLRPWGRIEGELRIGSRPGTNEAVLLLQDLLTPAIPLELRFEDYRTITDARDGRFSMDGIPPGTRHLVRLIDTGRQAFNHSHRLTVEVKPGEITRVTWGGVGRPIVGRLVDPGRPDRQWSPGSPYGHQILISRSTTRGFSSPGEAQAWQASPEGQEAFRRMRQYTPVIQPDGTLRIDDVPPGDYVLNLVFPDPKPDGERGVAGTLTLYRPLTVTEIPGGRSDAPLDLGELRLRSPNAPPH